MSSHPNPADERTATRMRLCASPAACEIATYRFGRSAEATRPDRVMRSPTAAILIQQNGQLFQHDTAGRRVALPRIAVLGPDARGHVWSTAPDTEFTLVALAPGALRLLSGLDPRDLEEQIEGLHDNSLSACLPEWLAVGVDHLHRQLVRMVRSRQAAAGESPSRVPLVLDALRDQACGGQISHYAEHFGVTPRTLQRVVGEAVGLSPKQILSVERVRRLVILTAGGWSRTLADLAQAGGYYDQSHLRYELLRHDFGVVHELVGGNHIVGQD